MQQYMSTRWKYSVSDNCGGGREGERERESHSNIMARHTHTNSHCRVCCTYSASVGVLLLEVLGCVKLK